MERALVRKGLNMDYFLLKQDERCTAIPTIVNWTKEIDVRNLTLVNSDKIKDAMVLYVKTSNNNNYVDILEHPFFLVSENIKKIIEKYDPNIIFKMICLVDFKNSKQNIYYLPIFEEIEALSQAAEMNLNKTVVKKLILNEEKINNKKIFKLKESSKTMVIVRLDVAESLLRRDFNGISLERLEIRSS
jgi:hypothetical protein